MFCHSSFFFKSLIVIATHVVQCSCNSCSHYYHHYDHESNHNCKKDQISFKEIRFTLLLLTAKSPYKHHHNIYTGNHHYKQRNQPLAHRHWLFQIILRLLILILKLLLNTGLGLLILAATISSISLSSSHFLQNTL